MIIKHVTHFVRNSRGAQRFLDFFSWLCFLDADWLSRQSPITWSGHKHDIHKSALGEGGGVKYRIWEGLLFQIPITISRFERKQKSVIGTSRRSSLVLQAKIATMTTKTLELNHCSVIYNKLQRTLSTQKYLNTSRWLRLHFLLVPVEKNSSLPRNQSVWSKKYGSLV